MGNKKGLFGRLGLVMVVVSLFAIMATAVLAYSIFSIEGEVAVLEGITVDEPLVYSVVLYPNEVDDRVFTLVNAGSQDTHVILQKTLTPTTGGVHLELSSGDNIIVPGNGSVQFHVIVSTDNNVSPGTYFVEVTVERDP